MYIKTSLLGIVVSFLLGSSSGLWQGYSIHSKSSMEENKGKRSWRTKEKMGNKGRRKRRESLLRLIKAIIWCQSMQRQLEGVDGMRSVVDWEEGGDSGGEREKSGGKRTWTFPTLGGCWVMEVDALCRLKNRPYTIDLRSASARINIFSQEYR